MTDEVTRPVAVGTADSTLGAQVAELETKVSSSMETDVKKILKGILKAGERTLAEMDLLRSRIEAADKATIVASEVATKKIKRADLVAAAKAAGAVDATEALQFVKLGDVTMDGVGDTNAAELITALKAVKPHLFAKSSTSAAVAAPAVTDPVKKSVLAMTKEEYAAAKAAIIKR